MSKSTATLNNNFKVCARIKPLEYSSRMLEVTGDNTVTIRDINNKTNMEKQNFRFNRVFDAFSKQDNLFQYVVENGISKALDGTNCCVISYGQTGAGKTFTTFGEDDKYSTNTINLYSDTQKDKRGVLPKTIEYLLNKNQEMAGVRELILTCNFVEIYLDQVRDLSRNHIDRNQLSSATKRNSAQMDFNTTTYDNESLEIYEHANGQMLIRNVKNVIIKNMDELYSLLGSGFKIREKAESKGNQIWARAHTIFTINIVQKEVENEDLPFPKSMIQFVDLAGSERIAKSITEGQHKFQEAVLIMSHLTSLYKVLAAIAVNSKNIPYRDSKLTKLLSNCLNPYNNIIMVAHLHPAESNFEETLNTLQYAERCKNIDFKEKKMGAMAGAAVGGGAGAHPGTSGNIEESGMFGNVSTVNNDKMWKKMNDEIADLKNKLETFQKDHKIKLERIQTYLGLEIDLDRISANPLSKEAQVLSSMRNVHMENQNLKIAVGRSDEEIEMMRREVDDDRKDFYSKQNKTESKLVEVREQIKRDTEKFKTDKNKDEEALRKQINQLTQENKKLLQHNTQLLDEKTHAIMNFNANLNNITREINQNTDLKNIGKREAENQYKDEVTALKKDHQAVQESLRQQYEHWLKVKNDELDHYAKRSQEYQSKKKEQINGMKGEMLEMYRVIQTQEKIIDKVEGGAYSGGIRSFHIPGKDKCPLPNRQKYPYLYKMLDEKKTESTTKTLYRDTTKEMDEVKEDDKIDTRRSVGMGMMSSSASKSQGKLTIVGTGTSLSKTSEKLDEIKAVDLELNVNKLHNEDLRRYAENVRKLCKEFKDREKGLKEQAQKYVDLNVYGDIHQIIKDRDQYKNLYREEFKKNNDNKIIIESQKRLLKSPSKNKLGTNMNMNSQPILRPQTSGHR